MKVKKVDIDEIIPADYNPRKDLTADDAEYQAIERSLERWGMVEPLVWNKTSGRLVSGHQRLKVLKAKGEARVDVVVVELDEAEERALSVALNKVSGAWDTDKLTQLLMGLESEAIDLTITGFNEAELSRLLAVDTPLFVPAAAEQVDVAALTAEAVTAKDVAHAAQAQAKRFEGAAKKIKDVACPNCGHEFGVE